MSENTNTYNEYVPQQVRITRNFSTIESVFAWISLLYGYLFCRVFPVTKSPLGGLCFIILLFAVSTVILTLSKYKFKAFHLCVAASAVIIASSLFLTTNAFLHFLSYTYALASYCYFIYAVCGNELEAGVSNFILMDYFKAIVVAPFSAIGYLFRAMFSGKFQNGGKAIGKLILGIGITFIPTTLIFLLLSYDNAFTDLMRRIFDWNFKDVFFHLGSLILGIPLGMYMFGLFISSQDQQCKNVITKENCSKTSVKLQIVPAITAFTAIAPVLFLYVIFFISQWGYYISGFTGILPKKFSYAEYAREGFFQLCTVAVINFIILLCVILFIRRRENKKSILLKILSLLISTFTLILISTALSKMFLYIKYYGLTHKRIYATWFMFVLAVIFLIIILYQFLTKIKVTAVCACVAVALFGILALSNVDSRIAQYNVTQYKEGGLHSVDLQELYDLEYAAVPSMVDLAKYFEEKDTLSTEQTELKTRVDNYLNEKYEEICGSQKNVFDMTLPYMKARRMLNGHFAE